MNSIFPLEIQKFFSLTELGLFIDKNISWYERYLEEYNQSLGSLLRDQGISNEEELQKKLSEKGLTPQKTEKDVKDKKDAKNKKDATSSKGWFSFKGLSFSVRKENKAEIFFEAVDSCKKDLQKLKESKSLIDELQKIGLESDYVYSVYFVDGVPEKIFVEQGENKLTKYKFEIILSTASKSMKTVEENIQAS